MVFVTLFCLLHFCTRIVTKNAILFVFLLLLLLADRCNGNEKSSAISIKVILQAVIYKKRFFSLEKLMFFVDHGRG